MFRGIEITSRKNSGEIISQLMLFQTRSCFVLRLNGAELMFRGDEITSRNTLWVNN